MNNAWGMYIMFLLVLVLAGRAWAEEGDRWSGQRLSGHHPSVTVHRGQHVAETRDFHEQQLSRGWNGRPYRHNHFSHHHDYFWRPRYNYHHHRYRLYPYIYSAPAAYLSSTYVPLDYSGETYYYDQGVFYQSSAGGAGYAAVPPPVGAVVAVLPAGAVQVTVDGQVYFMYSDVYYQPVAGGYKVVEPPRE